jgi:hypothetical protein
MLVTAEQLQWHNLPEGLNLHQHHCGHLIPCMNVTVNQSMWLNIYLFISIECASCLHELKSVRGFLIPISFKCTNNWNLCSYCVYQDRARNVSERFSTTTTFTVNVRDDDDQNPSFIYQGCMLHEGSCINPEYSTSVSANKSWHPSSLPLTKALT